jgi:hypothetical protein
MYHNMSNCSFLSQLIHSQTSTMPLLLINLSSICLVFFFVYIARSIYLWQRLRHIPGPPSAAWTIWWQLSGAMSGRYHERLKDAADTHGSLSSHHTIIHTPKINSRF